MDSADSGDAPFTATNWFHGILVWILSLFSALQGTEDTPTFTTLNGIYTKLETVPHDQTAFTQGLVLVPNKNNNDGSVRLYEGTGLYGQSELRQVDLASGDVLQRHELDNQYFGEGIAYYEEDGQGRIIQLTWNEQTAFVYDSSDLAVLDEFSFTTTTSEGWGITTRNDTFVVSDGSSILHFWDSNFNEINTVPVQMRFFGSSVTDVQSLNELEWDPHTDTILANVWMQDYIVRIDPDTGIVKVKYDLTSLFPRSERPFGTNVLNGIALVPGEPDQVWVTGKKWPYMFRIRLLD